MAARTSKVKASLDDRINTLSRGAVEALPANQVFGAAIDLQALVGVSFFQQAHSWALYLLTNQQ
jgi:hypothetical protein